MTHPLFEKLATALHLQAKFEDDPIRIAAGRALTIKSLQRRMWARRQRRDKAKVTVSSELCSGDAMIHAGNDM